MWRMTLDIRTHKVVYKHITFTFTWRMTALIYCHSYLHTEAKTKWLPFCRRHFISLCSTFCILMIISPKCIPKCSIYSSSLENRPPRSFSHATQSSIHMGHHRCSLTQGQGSWLPSATDLSRHFVQPHSPSGVWPCLTHCVPLLLRLNQASQGFVFSQMQQQHPSYTSSRYQLIEAEWRIYASVNKPSLVQIICRLNGAKPLSEPMLEYCQLDT